MRLLLALCGVATLFAQVTEAPHNLGPGVTPPHILVKTAPEYPAEALESGIESTVILEIAVDAAGQVTSVAPLRLAGHGFDEAAIACVRKWKFEPGQKDGHPVAVFASVEVNFRLLGREQVYLKNTNLVRYNTSVAKLEDPNPAVAAKAFSTILDLSKGKFPPAMYSEGVWRITGQRLPKEPAIGMRLLLAAAEKGYSAAVGQAGYYYYLGRHVAEDKPRGLRMMKAAAEKGSIIAQLFLGDLERDTNPATAIRYLRLCAAQKQSTCQTLLGESLLTQPRDRWPEAMAWLQIAASRKHEPAQKLLDTHAGQFTPAEQERAVRMRRVLEPK